MSMEIQRNGWGLFAGALIAIFLAARATAQEAPLAAAPTGPRLDFPAGLDTDGAAIFVANSRNNTISRLDPSGAIVIIAGQLFKAGSADGTGPAALFNSPDGLTFFGGALYVADTDNSDIRKIVLATKAVTTIAGTANTPGTENGHGTAAHFNLPTQVCSDGKGTLYVADTGNSLIRKIVLADMTVSTIGGQAPDGEGKEDGPPSKSKFNRPRGLATDGKFLYVADTANNIVRKIDLSSNTTSAFAGSGAEGNDDGKATEATFNHPEAMATDGTTLYATDADNHAIRKINLADGSVSTLTLVNGHIGSGLAISKDGKTLYFSDTTENSVQQVDTSNGNFTALYPKGQ
jgi:DNA-binding beta-propeller fold protein YncE